jgi:pyruvate kinase
MMDAISRQAEPMRGAHRRPLAANGRHVGNRLQHALASAACDIARQLGAVGIVAFTQTGSTARYVSQRRPSVPVYALTTSLATCRRLALMWGVHALELGSYQTVDAMVEAGCRRLLNESLVRPGDTVVYIAGTLANTPGGSDMVKVHTF